MGPTGIAALCQCGERKLTAIGLESGETALNSINGYMDGLIFSSPASHFQIDGIPLSCADPNQTTREDVLLYYTRIIQLRNLKIRTRRRVIRISSTKSESKITCESDGQLETYIAKKIIFTAWFEPASVTIPGQLTNRLRVETKFKNPSELAGSKVAILGSGLSACETALALMRAGFRISLILRSMKSSLHQTPLLLHYMELTGSKLYDNIEHLRAHQKGLEIVHKGLKVVLECDVLIPRIGMSINQNSLKVLTTAGVLSKRMATQLNSLPASSKLLRNCSDSHQYSCARRVARAWPDLSDHFWHGKKNVHLVGGILHIGSSAAGVKVSIYTARTVVDVISRKRKPLGSVSLPRYLFRWALTSEQSINLRLFKKIRPVNISAQENRLRRFTDEDTFGKLIPISASVTDSSNQSLINVILNFCTGKLCINDILDKCARSGISADECLSIIYKLFYCNKLTWLPPLDK